MDNINPLSRFVGRDLTEAVQSLSVIQGQAKNSGSPYYALELKFVNGYSKRIFVNDAEVFAITQAIDSLTE